MKKERTIEENKVKKQRKPKYIEEKRKARNNTGKKKKNKRQQKGKKRPESDLNNATSNSGANGPADSLARSPCLRSALCRCSSYRPRRCRHLFTSALPLHQQLGFLPMLILHSLSTLKFQGKVFHECMRNTRGY